MENQTPFYKQIWFLGGVAASVWVLWGRDLIASVKKKEEENQ